MTSVIAAFLLVVAVFTISSSQPKLRVLDSRFRVLTAKVSRGTVHTMFDGPQLQGRVRLSLSRALWWLVSIRSIPVTRTYSQTDTCAFMFRWTGDFGHADLMGVRAEMMDGSGRSIPLRLDKSTHGFARANTTPGSGLGERPWSTEYIGVWFFDAPPAKGAYRMRLMLSSNELCVAEIKGRL